MPKQRTIRLNKLTDINSIQDQQCWQNLNLYKDSNPYFFGHTDVYSLWSVSVIFYHFSCLCVEIKIFWFDFIFLIPMSRKLYLYQRQPIGEDYLS